jgi:uncharacterized protein (TIGR03084 family)
MTEVSMSRLVDDLADETADVTALLRGLPAPDWDRPTPAAGWAVRDQVSHLAYFDRAATTALLDPDAFRREAADLMGGGDDFPDRIAERHRAMAPEDLYAWFVDARGVLLRSFGGAAGSTRLPWFGPDMSAASSVTARIMETWAHGQDLADALGQRLVPSARLRHVAHLGVRTRAFSYGLRDLPVPEQPVHVELVGPDGEHWEWGVRTARDTVRGPALDFCLVVTQRRHVDDTQLQTGGEAAHEWMTIAQAFAGPPGPGR